MTSTVFVMIFDDMSHINGMPFVSGITSYSIPEEKTNIHDNKTLVNKKSRLVLIRSINGYLVSKNKHCLWQHHDLYSTKYNSNGASL